MWCSCRKLNLLLFSFFITFILLAAFVDIYQRLMYSCQDISYEGYSKSSNWEACSVYAGVGSLFYLRQYSFHWSVSYLWTIFSAVEGFRILTKLICIAD